MPPHRPAWPTRYNPAMRTILAALLVASAAPALAENCDTLVDKVASAAQAQVGRHSADFAEFKAGDGTTLTLSCGGKDPSAVGAQHRGESPPDGYYAIFGRAGEAVTGIAADLLRDAARRARADAARLRHSTVPAGGALVTCSVTNAEKGELTMCAVIEQGDRS